MNIRLLLLGTTLLGSMYLSAQNHQISLGADVGIPVGDMADDGASLILGPTLGYETPTFGTTNLSLTLQAGYQLVFLNVDSDDPRRPAVEGWNMIPAQLGLKYYFTEPQLGFYAHVQAGIHAQVRDFGEVSYDVIAGVNDADTSTVSFPTIGVSSTLFSWALGVGYQMPNLDVSLRFNAMGSDDRDAVAVQVPGFLPETYEYQDYSSPAYSYIGIRIAYIFNLGGERTSPAVTP